MWLYSLGGGVWWGSLLVHTQFLGAHPSPLQIPPDMTLSISIEHFPMSAKKKRIVCKTLFHTWEHMAFIINHNSFAFFLHAMLASWMHAYIDFVCWESPWMLFYALSCRQLFPPRLKVMRKKSYHKSAPLACTLMVISLGAKLTLSQIFKWSQNIVSFLLKRALHCHTPSSDRVVLMKCTKWQRRSGRTSDTALPAFGARAIRQKVSRHVF